MMAAWRAIRRTALGRILGSHKLSRSILERVYRARIPSGEFWHQCSGYGLYLNPLDSGITRRYLVDGEHEGYEKGLILAGLGFDNFIDVGANVGDWSLCIAAHRPNCAVYAFEPHPELFSMLQRSIRKNGFKCIQAWNLGLAADYGTLTLYCDSSNQGNNSLIVIPDDLSDKSYVVPVAPLGDVLSIDNLQGHTLLKIDVQGFEYEVIRGLPDSYRLDDITFLLEVDRNTTQETFAFIEKRRLAGAQLVGVDDYEQEHFELDGIEALGREVSRRNYFDLLIVDPLRWRPSRTTVLRM